MPTSTSAPISAVGPSPKRFYKSAAIEPEGDGFVLALDGRRARTPGRAPLSLPTRPLADAIAAEWNAQGATIEPRSMPLTKIANSAIDGVAPDPEAVAADLARYGGSDLIVYRAGEPEKLVEMQSTAWDPVVLWAKSRLGARLVLRQGLTFVDQPPESLDRIGAAIRARSPFRLAALHVMTTLTGSVLVPLMHTAGDLDAEAAWHAAHVDEHFQESRWGQDHEAMERRAFRRAEFDAASRFHRLA